jgi:hypothetical protein
MPLYQVSFNRLFSSLFLDRAIMAELQTKIPSDTWFVASWSDYIQTVEDSSYEKAKCYYNQGRARVEMSPVGNSHASDHAILTHAIYLFATLKGIDLNGKDCCSYRKIGIREVQPDLSFYVGENAEPSYSRNLNNINFL